MIKRFAAFLLALVAVVAMMGAPPAAADGIIGDIADIGCEASTGPILGTIIDAASGTDLCDLVGDEVDKKVKDAWKAVQDSIIGDFLEAAQDAVKWLLKKMLTVSLMGPSLNLEDTGLFGQGVTLGGMMIWLGWVIATFGLMWQLGKMAVTGQMKYAGQALVGFVQNALITGVGLTIVATLLKLGDAMTTGLVEGTFGNDGEAYERIVAVMMPAGIANPAMILGVVLVLLLVGFVQMVLVFLRQAAIPIQCLMLPIAGAGRVGGDTTRQWAPRLITSICVVIAYKPILAIIICAGFAQFGHSATLSAWLRGLATLVLAVLAPGPLTKLFAPLGAEMGAGLAAGGALGAAANVGSYIGKGSDGGGSDDSGSSKPVSAVEHAKYVEQTMQTSKSGAGGPESAGGGDAAAQAARTQANAKMPAQAGAADSAAAGAGTGAGSAAGAGASAGAGAGTGAAAGGAAAGGAAAAGPAGIALVVLDGVNDGVQKAAGEIGDGGSKP
ncbi:hypothetical protein PV379_10715 [Streptomyces caniscabiei]|uniref:hypothetical protein n=1 Tax=Streptomyces caniscabiei TaxID=2746961 RepID=UPI0029A2BC8C|nr:hypothetical protein [Streptomyces caniscabiei]MDX2601941.1 hypothetical protein [Streptomyces caniscabiei]MDX2737376.1 hypothetical protein [Streptomyces caniscabiei]MDX2777781.1 hypothetical protein [Streptomyces caniscabiei]